MQFSGNIVNGPKSNN